MKLYIHRYILISMIILNNFNSTQCILKRRNTRHVGETSESKGTSAPLLSDEIDMDTIEGIEQVTKLVLIKTDSLPSVSDNERIHGRYLNSLMETLYTGLRKPFKSVSADILGIFPSFEEIKVRCDKTKQYSNEHLEKDESIMVKRKVNSSNDYSINDFGPKQGSMVDDMTRPDESRRNESLNMELLVDSNDVAPLTYKSSLQVCQAVTDDCLSMEDLIQILPPTITTFDKAIVRLCPIMLFRIMNHLCEKYRQPASDKSQDEIISAYDQVGKVREVNKDLNFQANNNNNNINNNNNNNVNLMDNNLNNLLRETKILKNLQSSDDLANKKPQKLHKKLKTQTSYKNNGRLNQGVLQQHGSVDEQLLKIRLKLTEPSIEKVWIFSLLFVILSIVVSMGGLIVLPFVKKTTRRRILTLFEGLAVGGLAGSATLHMFPQAFGLVDENYHKYFWRIFVVFFGIYLCYLCERIIKIVKVVRAKVRRSRASLDDMELYYGFTPINREFSRNTSSRFGDKDHEFLEMSQYSRSSKRDSKRKRSKTPNYDNSIIESVRFSDRDKAKKNQVDKNGIRKLDSKRKNSKSSKIKRELFDGMLGLKSSKVLTRNNASDGESISALDADQSQTRQRLVHCLKSVQRQFSPVYAVQTQNMDGTVPANEPRAGRLMRLSSLNQDGKRNSKRRVSLPVSLKRNKNKKDITSSSFFGVKQTNQKTFLGKKNQKQKDVETMLYHRRLMRPQYQDNRIRSSFGENHLQNRLTSFTDVAAERQDQDNAARMSVDTVAWMIVFGDAVLNVIDGLSIGAAFERNILAGISISVAVMLEEVTHRLGTFAVLIRAGMSMQQSLLCTFISACALFPGLIVGILLSDATEDATPYIFCAAGGIFLYMALVDVMKEMNRSIENAIRKDIKSTLQIFALQNVGIILAVIFLSFLALYEQAMDFEEYQIQYNQPS